MIMRELYGKKRMALVVVDAQRKFRSDRFDWEDARDGAVTSINRLMYMFRQVGSPVVLVQYEGNPVCRPYEGDDGDEYFPGLAVRPGDVVVVKHHMNGFLDTDLENVLRDLDVDMILLCGTVTQYCVMSTYFAAMDRGIVPYLAHGATISTTSEIAEAAEVVCKTLTEDTVGEFLGVKTIPEGEVPVQVSNVVSRWDDSLLCDVVALANCGGGHFVVGYPSGVKDNETLAHQIEVQVESEVGIRVTAEAIEFCAHPAVNVVVPAASEPVTLGGQRFKASLGYSY